MYTLAFINWKGGVGKTTLSTNTAYLAATKYNKKVLFIDADKQGNASRRFEAKADYPNLTNIFLDGYPARDAIQRTKYENIDIIASDASLLDANLAVLKESAKRQDNILAQALEPVQALYDLCIIDNPPDSNITVLNVLEVINDLFVVTTLDADSFDGVYQLQNELESINKGLGTNIKITSVLVNKFKKNASSFAGIKKLKDKGFRVYEPYFRNTAQTIFSLQQATEEHKSIYEISPNCGFSMDLNKFVKELLRED